MIMTPIAKAEDRAARTNNASANATGSVVPQANIVETKDSFLLEAEMPGVSKEGLEVFLEGNELTIVGRRQTGVPGATPLYRESSLRDFRREFVLDPSIDTSKLTATIEQGLLKVTLPKTEKVKPRKIQVTG
jgi:HSP20 family protein